MKSVKTSPAANPVAAEPSIPLGERTVIASADAGFLAASTIPVVTESVLAFGQGAHVGYQASAGRYSSVRHQKLEELRKRIPS